MGVFTWLAGVLRGAGSELETFGVKEITNETDLAACLAKSQTGPVFIFKHSTTCPISAAAHHRVGEYLARHGDTAPAFYLVKVIESRPLSNAIAEQLRVRHESPQLLLVRSGAAVWNASHGAITEAAIIKSLGSKELQG